MVPPDAFWPSPVRAVRRAGGFAGGQDSILPTFFRRSSRERCELNGTRIRDPLGPDWHMLHELIPCEVVEEGSR